MGDERKKRGWEFWTTMPVVVMLVYFLIFGPAYLPGPGVIFAAVGAAYAAFCIWLTVRVVNRREKHLKRMAAIAIAPWTYALSFGPMASLGRNGFIPDWMGLLLGFIYAPLIWFLNEAPEAATQPLSWISTIWP
jgi:hypothetical protein